MVRHRHCTRPLRFAPSQTDSAGARSCARALDAGGVIPNRVRKFYYANFIFFSGRLRTGLPVAAKIAFRTAGATTLIVGSPTPPQKS